MKLVLVLTLLSVVVFHETAALWRFRIRLPGPIGMLPRRSYLSGRDVAGDLDKDDDGYLDETELAKYLNERDIDNFMDSLDENGDNLVSLDEFIEKN